MITEPNIEPTKVKEEDLLRDILVEVCRDGTLSYRHRDETNPVNDGAPIPAFSVDNIEEAKMLQATFGKKYYQPHPDTGEAWYVLPWFSGDIKDVLDVVGAYLKTFYENNLAGQEAEA